MKTTRLWLITGSRNSGYSLEEMHPIPLDEEPVDETWVLQKKRSDGAVKYKKDSFRLVTPKKGDFSNIEMWWREDRRHFNFPLGVHELQNLHLEMTKVHLEKP